MGRALAAVAAALVAVSSASAGPPPPVTAKAYLVENGATGEVLARGNPNVRLPIASITKLMTVLVALEHADVDDVVVAGPGAARSASRRSTCALASASPWAISSRQHSSRAPTTRRGRSRRMSARVT
jgi:D-alanyl-D-alanine carboxypeptidase